MKEKLLETALVFLLLSLLFSVLLGRYVKETEGAMWEERVTELQDSISRLELALEFQIHHHEGLDGELIECWVRRPQT